MATGSENHWEHFEHGADIGVRGWATTCAGAFEQAALAMTAVVTDPDRIRPVQAVDIVCEAPDDELLFVDWLNALIYEMATRRMLFSRFDVDIDDGALRARAWGENLRAEAHDPIVEVKGATYTNVRVERCADGRWIAQCVVDV
jgi:tRNA nucleotidyltransferase (CCA-adding enzyme)